MTLWPCTPQAQAGVFRKCVHVTSCTPVIAAGKARRARATLLGMSWNFRSGKRKNCPCRAPRLPNGRAGPAGRLEKAGCRSEQTHKTATCLANFTRWIKRIKIKCDRNQAAEGMRVEGKVKVTPYSFREVSALIGVVHKVRAADLGSTPNGSSRISGGDDRIHQFPPF